MAALDYPHQDPADLRRQQVATWRGRISAKYWAIERAWKAEVRAAIHREDPEDTVHRRVGCETVLHDEIDAVFGEVLAALADIPVIHDD